MKKAIEQYKNTFFKDVNPDVWNKASKVKLLLCDVDGVLSNGFIYLGDDNIELKTFHVHDGYGIKALLSVGINVGVITGRNSQIVTNRMTSLGISIIHQGVTDKIKVLKNIMKEYNLKAEEIAYIGDDLVDFEAIKLVGLGISTIDGHNMLHQISDWSPSRKGGYGAVRELCELILFAQDKFHKSHGISL